ncbi:MAG: sulfite exporter TauE/SafE family protein [Pseudodesulfovibrio sp.]
MPEILFFSAIIMAAGFLQGLTGFGFVLIALPLLDLFLPLKTIIPLACLLALCISLALSLQLRKHVDLKCITLLFAATLPAVPFGVYLLKHVPAPYLSITLGALMVAFTSHQLLARPAQRDLGTGWTLFAGLISGALAGSIGAGGPPVIIYSTLRPWDKNRAKATLALYFLLSGIFVSSTHAVSGLITDDVIRLFLHALPALAAGIALGSIAYGRISDHGYRRLALVLVLTLGGLMLFRNV